MAGIALLVTPVVAMRVDLIEQRALAGVAETATRPPWRFASLLAEDFQKKFVGWFEQNYGLRPTLVRLDNSIGYRLFHETRIGSNVQVGLGDMLLNHELTSLHNRLPSDPEHVRNQAKLALDAQKALLAEGKVLILLLLPSKVSVFPDSVPAGWTAPLTPRGQPRPWLTTMYEPFVAELERLGVLFVDGPRLLAPMAKAQPSLLYVHEGRHLNPPAACLVFEAGLALARPLLRDWTIPSLDCGYDLVPGNVDVDEEYDFYRVLNVWGKPRTTTIARLHSVVPETTPESRRPDALIVGSSFAGRIFLEARRNHAFGKSLYYYYNRTVEDGVERYPVPDATSDRWRELTLSKQIFLLPIPQDYLPDAGREFFEQILKALSH